MNEYERTKQEYEMRLLNDSKELEIIKQVTMQRRIQQNYQLAVVLDTVDRELKVIQGEGSKSVAEIKEMTKAQELNIPIIDEAALFAMLVSPESSAE